MSSAMNCCCARKQSSRDVAPGQATVRRGIPTNDAHAIASRGAPPGTPTHSSVNRQNVGGVGIVFQVGPNGDGLVVASLAVDGPAEQSGQVHAGDVLVSIDRIDVREMSAEDIAQYILGAPGSRVRLGFVRPESTVPSYVELTRGWTMKRTVESRWSNPLPPNHALVPGAIGPE